MNFVAGSSRRAVCLALFVVSACGAREEGAAPVSEAVDSLHALRDHGELAFGTWIPTVISASQPTHAWSFELSDAATVSLRTEASSEGEVDTLLALYREGPRGWGRAIARNDDARDSVLSALSRRLHAGRYRVVVRGYDASAVGAFILASECSGTGCPRRSPECLFGDNFYELLHGEERGVAIVEEEQLASVAQLRDPMANAQLVLAVQQSSHSDVTTASEALARVDQQTVRRLTLIEPEVGRGYTAYEYGAGDNSYGAIFVRGTLEIAASIHDGDFLNCTAVQAPCLVPSSYSELLQSDEFEAGGTRLLTPSSLSELTPVEREQLLTTLRLTYSEADAPTLEALVESADGGEVNQLRLRHRASGRTIVVYQHRAGDTSVGGLFEEAEPRLGAIINDGAVEDCRLLEAG